VNFYRIKMDHIENAERAESDGKWQQSIIFHCSTTIVSSGMIVGIGTDGRSQSPKIELSY
jgi:hypothetical protein